MISVCHRGKDISVGLNGIITSQIQGVVNVTHVNVSTSNVSRQSFIDSVRRI